MKVYCTKEAYKRLGCVGVQGVGEKGDHLGLAGVYRVSIQMTVSKCSLLLVPHVLQVAACLVIH